MELHVYSPLAGCPTLDPACLAALWLAELSNHNITVYPSSNTHLSPTGVLPVLVEPSSEPVTGYPEIATRILGRALTSTEVALIAYCQSLAVITQWNLFIVPENYEGLTRPEISASIPFPMQYNAALSLQHQAQANQPPRAKNSKNAQQQQEGINKLHAAILEQNKDRERARETPKETLRRMVQINEIFDTVKPFLSEMERDSPASLLVAANLVLLTMPRLPSRPLASIIEQNEQLTDLRDYGRSLNFTTSKYTPQVPTDKTYSLWNTVSAYVHSAQNAPSILARNL